MSCATDTGRRRTKGQETEQEEAHIYLYLHLIFLLDAVGFAAFV